MKNPSILLTTLGASWAVIPELLHWIDNDAWDFYENHPDRAELDARRGKYGFAPVAKLWVVSTSGTGDDLDKTKEWLRLLGNSAPAMRVFTYSAEDINTAEDARRFRELVFRAVLLARREARGGKLWLSLAGGRKTMSADIQAAAAHFGCDGLLHVLDRSTREEHNTDPLPRGPREFLAPWPAEKVRRVLPLVSEFKLPGNRLLDELDPDEFPPDGDFTQTTLRDKIDSLQQKSADLFANYRQELLETDEGTNFLALYSLPPGTVMELKNTKFGTGPEKAEQELSWLRLLPKAELHCHLGGVLDAAGMIEIAACLAEQVEKCGESRRPVFKPLSSLVQARDPQGIRSWLKQRERKQGELWKSFRNLNGLPEPLGVCAFLLMFRDDPELLDEVIYGGLRDPERFVGYPNAETDENGLSAFDRYEQLGDLQGSGLLQHELTIRAAVNWWLNRCAKENVRYLELRCSPVNYTRGGLSAETVVRVIREACAGVPEVETRLIFIGSRHGKSEELEKHIKLAENLLDETADEGGPGSLAGFDLAGAEERKEPGELREAFLPLLERCLSVTIHAGETRPAQNIWEAVYHLQADRIGHGLTLKDNPELIPRFRDRRIGIELCPSSNMQIVGFRDAFLPGTCSGRVYPLREYLRRGLRVAVNTDNPGISRTSPSAELHRAARMTPEGLSVWEILQLVRNSFRASFADHRTRSRLLREAEETLIPLLRDPLPWTRPPPDP